MAYTSLPSQHPTVATLSLSSDSNRACVEYARVSELRATPLGNQPSLRLVESRPPAHTPYTRPHLVHDVGVAFKREPVRHRERASALESADELRMLADKNFRKNHAFNVFLHSW